jgi:hypothetical protein
MTLSVTSADYDELDETGAFELGEGIEANYSTCVHCIVVVQDAGEADAKRFFPVAGTMNISAATPAGQPTSTASKGAWSAWSSSK